MTDMSLGKTMSEDTLSLSDILMPLAITVIIDSKVKEREIDSFIEQGVALASLFGIHNINRETVLNWYKSNETVLREKLAGKRRNTLVLRSLTRFKDDVHIENVFEAMVAISVSDDEYHYQESELIRSAAAIWGYQRPPIKVDKRK